MKATRNVCSVAGSLTPDWTRRIDRNVRIISPDPTSSTRASATCAVVSKLRVRLRSRPALALRLPARSTSTSGTRVRFRMGIAPKIRLATTDSTSAKASDDASTAIDAARGRLTASVARTTFTAPAESAMPTAPATSPSSRFSTNIRARPPRRADGRAHVEFLRAPFGADEHQVGDVRAGDEQHDPERRHDHPEAVADVAHDVIDERAHIGPETGIFHLPQGHALRRREQRQLEPDHPGHVSVNLRQRDARQQPTHGSEVVAGQTHGGTIEAQRHHDVVRGVHEPEALRQHPR